MGWKHKRPYEQRPFVILEWIVRKFNEDEIKYIVGFDSDTAWNLNLLPSLLADLQPPRLSMHGYMYKAWGTTYPTGGAGVILTMSAAHALVNAANSGSCKMSNTNFDVMLGRCADAANVERVHVEGMWQQPVGTLPKSVLTAPWGVLSVHKYKSPQEVAEAFSLSGPCQ
ncbi:hypothetical protein Pmar_PMAR015074 [Perkinsus marinus ATCC 50983]|nr:hypothetical protein Pmar_PMAR015074 [Perkinsus marinus ATCC 50983]EER13859.1 hypothetical protein Pmar_PMAR015074 [Perkinsus marinus ATCC 50983]|eukprot:XP_002782064.1 hypothetical protein Pmar_PMAR015074 [Perkinsus marinus ATCC 50983]